MFNMGRIFSEKSATFSEAELWGIFLSRRFHVFLLLYGLLDPEFYDIRRKGSIDRHFSKWRRHLMDRVRGVCRPDPKSKLHIIRSAGRTDGSAAHDSL